MKIDFDDFVFYFLICCVCLFFLFLPFFVIQSSLDELTNKVVLYEKILNREYDRTFESYEDYLLYRIEIGK